MMSSTKTVTEVVSAKDAKAKKEDEGNQLIADEDKDEDTLKAEKEAKKPDRIIFAAFKYIIYRRGTDTVNYMKERYKKKEEEKKGASCLSKCGSLLKTLIIYSVAAALIIPFIFETYNKVMNKGKGTLDQDFDTVSTSREGRLTPEEIAKRAQDREREREEAFEAKMQAFEEEMGINDDQVVNEDQDDEFASKINEEL